VWALRNQTGYAAERNWTRDREGVHWWVVAVRATYDVGASGRLALAGEQPPPVLVPVYFGEPGGSSLRYDSDLLAVKPGTDVLVQATAHAPAGRAAASVPVALRVGALEKRLIVHGDRVYYRGTSGLTITAARPFTERPIRYELAYGGRDLADPDPRHHRIDDRNPLGRGFAVRAERLINQPAHSIEYPAGDPAQRGPAGFGPVDAAWIPRRALAGTYDQRWEQSKKPLLPDDYDPRFAMSAPADQQLATPLVGGERVSLTNLTREGTLAFELPRVALGFSSRFGRRREEHSPRLATLLIEPEELRVSLVWQSALRVTAEQADYLDETEIVEARSAG